MIIEQTMMKKQKNSLNSACRLEFAIPSPDPKEFADNYIYLIGKNAKDSKIIIAEIGNS